MRQAYNEVQFLIDEKDIFKGISIGFDFCAEHEWGAEGLNNKFAFQKKVGFQKATKNPFNIIQETENRIIYSTYDKIIESDYFINGINSMWDKDNIQLIFDKKIINKNIIEQFNLMIKNCDLCFGSYLSGFRNSKCLLKYSAIPKKQIKEAEDKEIELKKSREKFKNSKAIKSLEKAQREFKKSKQFDNEHYYHHTPYSIIYLDVHSNGNGIWLNPYHQNYLNSGWVKESDIIDWVNGKQGKIIKDKKEFEYLKWECSMDAWNIMYYKKYYSGVGASNYMVWEKGKGNVSGKLLPLLKGKMTEEKRNQIYDMIDDYIKSEIYYYMNIYWMNYNDKPRSIDMFPKGKNNKPLLPIIENLPKSNKKEIEGILFGVGAMGMAVGIFDSNGYSNTPERKSNWSWWRDIICREAEYQLWVKLGLIPEEYQGRN